MVTNYTPLDVVEFSRRFAAAKKDTFNTVLLILVTFTTLVFAILLFILIQKKLNGSAMTDSVRTIAEVGIFHG